MSNYVHHDATPQLRHPTSPGSVYYKKTAFRYWSQELAERRGKESEKERERERETEECQRERRGRGREREGEGGDRTRKV